MHHMPLRAIQLTVISAALLAANGANAITVLNPHVTDGFFNGSSSSTAAAPEWDPTRSTVSKSFFQPATGNSGNAFLYVEQNAGVLYLMYDYIRNDVGPVTSSSFFDVFFEVKPTNTDYGIHINQSGFTRTRNPSISIRLSIRMARSISQPLHGNRFQPAIPISRSEIFTPVLASGPALTIWLRTGWRNST
jgi:hypothetical protein